MNYLQSNYNIFLLKFENCHKSMEGGSMLILQLLNLTLRNNAMSYIELNCNFASSESSRSRIDVFLINIK